MSRVGFLAIGLAALLALLGFAGCGGDDEGDGETSTDTAAETTDTADETSTDEQVTTTTSEETEESVEPEAEGLASKVGRVDGFPVELTITELVRGGDTMTLTLSLMTDPDEDQTAEVGGEFDNGIYEDLTGAGANNVGISGATLDGITLIDTTNKQRYLVARDADNVCVCDVDLGTTSVGANAPTLLSATYGAPPEDVTAVDVMVPGYGTFRDVPIS